MDVLGAIRLRDRIRCRLTPMPISRRDLTFLLPALAASLPASAADGKMSSTIFRYEDLPVKVNGQNKGRAVLNTTTHGGFPVELHMTELGPGQSPHAPHHHAHEEIVMLRRGMLEANLGGKIGQLTAGSIIFVESDIEHGWRNPGTEPAEYFVIALGNGKT